MRFAYAAVAVLVCAPGCAFIDDFGRFETPSDSGAGTDGAPDVDGGADGGGGLDAARPDAAGVDGSIADAGPVDSGCGDTQSDPANCGTCGHACGSGVLCELGVCADAVIVDIAVGANHTCALRESGEVLCWGKNDSRQLGDGTTTGRSLPTPADLAHRATEVTAGRAHSCALAESGRVYCWGANFEGQLGDGTRSERSAVVAATVSGARAVVAGSDFTCALMGIPGEVHCWGDNRSDQLGRGAGGSSHHATPGAVVGLSDAVSIVAGTRHACAIKEDGIAVCWGEGRFGQLGDGDQDNEHSPVAVSGLTNVSWLATGDVHTCASVAGAVSCFGANSHGQLGVSGMELRTLPEVVTIESVSLLAGAGSTNHTCAITAATGTVLCWGQNSSGQLGDGTYDNRDRPVVAAGLMGATDVATNQSHTCALRGGGVLCWGRNADGQLGDGTTAPRPRPTQVVDIP